VAWEVEFTDQFGAWWNSLSESEQDEIQAKLTLLQEHGPTLPRPHADVIVSSRHSNYEGAEEKSGGPAFTGLVRIRS